MRVKKDIQVFQGPDDPTFIMDPVLAGGPHLQFVAPKRSPTGIKPFIKTSELLKPLLRSPLFHGGEQMLFAAYCIVDHQADEKVGMRLVALTSMGRLFVVKGGRADTSVHATAIATATIRGDMLQLQFVQQRREWRIRASTEVAAQLGTLLWQVSSTAHAACLMRVNLARLPLELLPPLAIDGNLHTCFVMYCRVGSIPGFWPPPCRRPAPNDRPTCGRHANAHGIEEAEDVLATPNPTLNPALLCVRRWTLKMEVDVSEWAPTKLAPLADAMKYNTAFFAFKAVDAPQLGDAVGSALVPMLTCNTRLVVLHLENIHGKPASIGRLCDGLAANAVSGLSVINLSRNELGADGARRLALGLRRLRPGLLAELHLSQCRIDATGMAAVLEALTPATGFGGQCNLLQLQLSANELRAAGAQLALLLANTRRLEQLAIGHSAAEIAPFGNLLLASLRSLRKLDLSGIAWGLPLIGLLNACGPQLSHISLDGTSARTAGAATLTNGPPMAQFLGALFQRAAASATCELELSTPEAPLTLLPDLLPTLLQGYLPTGLVLRHSALGDAGLLTLLSALAQRGAASPVALKELNLTANWMSSSAQDDLDAAASSFVGSPAFNENTSTKWVEGVAQRVLSGVAPAQVELPQAVKAHVRGCRSPGDAAVAPFCTRLATVHALSTVVSACQLTKLSIGGEWRHGRAGAKAGPLLAVFLRCALPTNTSLEYLDISGNGGSRGSELDDPPDSSRLLQQP